MWFCEILNLTLDVAWDFVRFWPFCHLVNKDYNQRHFEETKSNTIISAVPADGLAGARTSAGTVMTKFRYQIYIHIYVYGTSIWLVYTLRARWNGCHFADNIFKCIFLMKTLILTTILPKRIYSPGSNWQYGSISSDNGLAPNRRQAIIWTNDGIGYWCIYASLSLNELRREIL